MEGLIQRSMDSNQSMVPMSYLSESRDLTSDSSDSELSLSQGSLRSQGLKQT